MKRSAVAVLLLAIGSCSAVSGPTRAEVPPVGSFTRFDEPVVLTGDDAAGTETWRPGQLVAFRWRARAWQQVPVQVDERAVVSFRSVYGGLVSPGGWPMGDFSSLVYTDADTTVGRDPVRTIDDDDEIVFMVRDTGVEAPLDIADPVGTREGRVHLKVTDPLSKSTRHIYLYRQDGSLEQGAGRSYVDYDFVLQSGDYPSTYDFEHGPNPESSTVRTRRYRLDFSDRWTHDRISMRTGTGVDILERQTFMFYPGYCGRSEKTFRENEGAFLANVSGPVRAIRSFIGANSGPLTQRDVVMYGPQYEVRTYLRVHPIPGGVDAYDYSDAAIGMTYRTNLDPAGVTVDGVPETTPDGELHWEQMSGPQGTLTLVHLLDTSFAATSGAHRLDDSTPDTAQCTGDSQALGLSGPSLGSIPNTDPSYGAAHTLSTTRVAFVEPPGLGARTARQHRREVLAPLRVSVSTD